VRALVSRGALRIVGRGAVLAFVVTASLAGLACSAEPTAAPAQVNWQPAQSAPGITDLAGPRSDGRLVVAVGQGLSLFGRGALTPFAFPNGPGSYTPAVGEPYITLTPKVKLRRSRCSFHRDDVFAVANDPPRVVRINRAGFASTFASLPSGFLGAIGFDRVGSFGHRLLVAATANNRTTLRSIDCRGRANAVVVNGPLIEGGIEVAPRTFGRFAGQLIGVDELGGNVVAFKRNGLTATVAASGLPTGGDIGVESVGFVPPHLGNRSAFLADRGVPGNPHPGTDSILRVSNAELRAAQIRSGDLLVATEGGALTLAIRCPKRGACGVRQVGSGPTVAHAEGHIVFQGG
jgi:hypothetical protein